MIDAGDEPEVRQGLLGRSSERLGLVDIASEPGRQLTLLKTGALQDAIFNSANFSSIATD